MGAARRRSAPVGTRKIAPIEARNAFGDVGSAHPGESATNAGPSASAVRTSVPTLPGSPTCQRASPVGASSSSGGQPSGRPRRCAAGGPARKARRGGLLDLLRPLEPLELDRPLGVDERLDRPDAGGEAGGDEILALADEQAELRALPSRRKLAHELQARVRGRSDHETQSIVLAWPSRRASRRRPSGHVSTSSAKP